MSRATINISVPELVKAYVDKRVGELGYGTVSEFFRELIRRDQQLAERAGRQAATEQERMASAVRSSMTRRRY